MASFVFAFLLLVMFSMGILQVHSSISALVRQFHQCNNLKMIRKNDSFGGSVYVPDPKVPNNTLNDAYYRNIGLANMTFNETYAMVARIYDAIGNKCKGPNCICYNSYIFHSYDDHTVMFINVTILEQAKRIVWAFIEKFRPNLYSESEINNEYVHYYTPTLIQLLVKYDYSLERLYMYNTSSDEFYSRWGMHGANQNLTLQASCEWATNVANRAVITNPTSAQLEQKMTCELINVVNKSEEFQRFYALNTWAVSYSGINLGNQMLRALFDKLLRNARTYNPTVVYNNIDLIIYSQTLKLTGYRSDKIVNRTQNTANFTMCAFNSPQLRIDAERIYINMRQSYLRWVNISIFQGNNIRPVYYNISYNSGFNNLNGTTVKDSKGANILQVVAGDRKIEVYDFISNSKISFWNGHDLKITSQVRFFQTATGGIMIRGFESSSFSNSG